MIESAGEYTFFPSAHRTFSRPDHILGHKLSLGKFKKTEIINTWRLNNMLQNNQWITKEIKEEIKKHLETN